MLPDADYQFYRIVGNRREGACQHPALLQAMYTAWMNGVDILNVSGGYEATENRELPSEREITKFADHGLTTVSALGNYIKDVVTEPTFPAKHPDVIGVSGYEPYCNSDKDNNGGEKPHQGYTFGSKSANNTSTADNNYCGYGSCQDGVCTASEECSLTETTWDGNVTPSDNSASPDVYAPVRYPVENGNRVTRKSGTSYSAPLVVATIGAALDDAKQAGRDPSPKELQIQLKKTGTPLTADDGYKPNAANLLTALKPDDLSVPSLEEE